MYIKTKLNALTQLSINEHAYNSKIPLISCKKFFIYYYLF